LKKWLIEINSKLSEVEKFLKIFGIKPMTTCELKIVEAETLESAIKQSVDNPKEWNISGRESTEEDTIFMTC